MFYIGAYLGYVADNKLRSLSGKTPVTGSDKTIGNFRTFARNNGAPNGNGTSGYDIIAWYQMTYLIAMYTLKYKNLNCKLTIGLCSRNDNGNTTGETNTKGLDWGDKQTKNNHMKLFGVEDMYSNMWCWVDGMMFNKNSNNHIYTATENFNDSATNYIDRGAVSYIDWNNNFGVTKVAGDTHKGFTTTKNTGGSATTYYCCYGAAMSTNTYPVWLGTWSEQDCSIYGINTRYNNEYKRVCITSRLMYL